MDYERSIPIHGSPARALETVRNQFIQQGFRLTDATATSFEAVGPGMQSNQQNALRGASRVRVSASGGELVLQAELGGVRFMQRFIMFFPAGLCLFLLAIFWIIPWFGMPPQGAKTMHTVALMVCGLNIMIWIPISIVWAPAIRRSVVRALDTAMDNAVQIAQVERSGI